MTSPLSVNELVPCPRCGDTSEPIRPRWFLWGGLVGSFVMRQVVRCAACRGLFHADSGAPSRAALPFRRLTIVLGVVVVVVVMALAFSG